MNALFRLSCLAPLCAAACSSDDSLVRFPPSVREEDLSAAALVGRNHLLLASDEGVHVQVLARDGDGTAFDHALAPIALAAAEGDELDIEAIAAESQTVYVEVVAAPRPAFVYRNREHG